MTAIDQIEGLALPIVERHGAFLVDLNIRGEREGKIVEVYIDTDDGVTTGLCASVSTELSVALDTANVIPGRYHLVVSSPGTDRPLKFAQQYRRNVGRMLKVKYRSGKGMENVRGELLESNEHGIILREPQGIVHEIEFDAIDEATVELRW
jgi:ribosome maturation factor RimP